MTTRAGRPQCKRKLMNEEVRIIRELHRQGHTHGVAAVMESLEAYTKKHSLDPAELIPLAMKPVSR